MRLVSENRFSGRIKALFAVSLTGLVIAILSVPATGHGIFKKTLERKYKEEGLRVTCYMCHIKGEEKTKRNKVGEVFFEEFKGQNLSERWDAVEGDDRKTLEADVMAPEFLKALEKIYASEAKGDAKTSYATQIPAGEVEGTKLKKRKTEVPTP